MDTINSKTRFVGECFDLIKNFGNLKISLLDRSIFDGYIPNQTIATQYIQKSIKNVLEKV